MDDVEIACDAILARCDRGAVSLPIALMELLIATESDSRVASHLASRAGSFASAPKLAALFEEKRDGCARIAAMLESGVDVPPKDASVDEGIAFCKRLFDWSVQQSEEASVALYSLGDPALLEAATREIVALFESWNVLGADRRALDVGCGIGRMETALASRLGSIDAIDVSERMIEAAQRRCGAIPNVRFTACDGRDLRAFDDGSFDLVFAIDSFPYLVQSGMDLVATHVAEAARVLRVGRDLVILNFSYRGDRDVDRRDVASLAGAHGFDVAADGACPFAIWNAPAFRLTKRTSVTRG